MRGPGREHDALLAVRRERDVLRDALAHATEFQATLEHEVRAPLRVATGLAELLRADVRGPQLRVADELVATLERLDGLVHAMARSHRGEFEPSPPLALHAAVAVALGELDAEIRRHGATVRVGDLPCAVGDGVALVQVIRNLVANAVLHTPDRRVCVHISGSSSGGVVEVAVADDGIGIDAASLQSVFVRGVGRDPERGSGLGLSICRRLVEGWGGHIWAAQAEGGGAVVRFTLPGCRGADGPPHG